MVDQIRHLRVDSVLRHFDTLVDRPLERREQVDAFRVFLPRRIGLLEYIATASETVCNDVPDTVEECRIRTIRHMPRLRKNGTFRIVSRVSWL